MKTEKVKLSQVTANAANPRQIKEVRFAKLVNSILIFPKMLGIRPIVVDDTFVALGGNMRYRALSLIAGMKKNEVKKRLAEIGGFGKKTAAEQELLVDYWRKWLENPTATIIKASELSDEERREFTIKDNVGFGEWDYDVLANEWAPEDLNDWGVDVWQKDVSLQVDGSKSGEQNLPDELNGLDLSPSELDKLKGDDCTLMKRVIICYKDENAAQLAEMLHLSSISKVVYSFSELQGK
jgi:hypothetical protein